MREGRDTETFESLLSVFPLRNVTQKRGLVPGQHNASLYLNDSDLLVPTACETRRRSRLI